MIRSSRSFPLAGDLITYHFDADDDSIVTRDVVTHFDGTKWQRTPQGGLRGPAALTKVGVFRYKHADGRIINEYRPADEVFHPDSIASLEQAPITDGHPPLGDTAGLVTPTNYTAVSKGQVTSIHHDATHVLGDAVIQDAALATAVLKGERIELSAGYGSKMDWTPGVYNGQAYDVVQRNIRYNHIALMPRGRGRQGTDVALRFDGVMLEAQIMIIHLDGKDFDMATDEGRAAYHAAMQAKVDAATAATKIAQVAADTAQAHADAADAELAPLRAATAATARTALETAARAVMGAKAPATFVGTDRQVRETAIGTDMTGKSEDYVLARFDGLVAAPAATDPALAAALAAMQPVDAVGVTPETPPAWTTRWKEPLTASKDR